METHLAKIISVPKSLLIIPPERQRTEVDSIYVTELSDSISRLGVIQPMVVRAPSYGELKFTLIAGWCRSNAIQQCWIMGQDVKCAGEIFPENHYPCIQLQDLDPIDAYEIELEENIRRSDISWQDKARATEKLLELRQLQAKRDKLPEPTVAEVAKELRGSSGHAQDTTRKELLVAKHLSNPEVAKATTVDQAFKVLKRQEELKRSEALGESVGATFTSAVHSLFKGDCLQLIQQLNSDQFDMILTDPPYGMNAQDFSDSGGKTPGEHFYDDSPDNFQGLMLGFAPESFRVTKPQAHLYCFCDIQWFIWLRRIFTEAGWKVFRTPIIWHNPTSMRAPWPEMGPQRKWQMALYAVKGSKPVNQLYSDLVTFPSDENLNHHAQKPVGLYQEFLKRSVRPGDSVLDPFCGSGTIFPAAHSYKCAATGIELDPKAYGIAVERLAKLK